MGECFFWYWLTRVVPDKFHRAVKRSCVCVCVCVCVCACLVMSFRLLRSCAKLFSSCNPVLHQLTMSSVHSLHGLPFFVPSTVPNIRVQKIKSAMFNTNFVSHCCKSFTLTGISRAHSFPRKILPNSTTQVRKFHSSPRENHPNFWLNHCLPFMGKLSCLLFTKYLILC